MKDSAGTDRRSRLRNQYGCQAFLMLSIALIAGEMLAVVWDWTDSFPRTLGALCLACGYYIVRCIWVDVYFRPGDSRAAPVLAITGGAGVALWRLLESFWSSRLSQEGIWGYRAVWIEALGFCAVLLTALGLKYLRERQGSCSGRQK